MASARTPHRQADVMPSLRHAHEEGYLLRFASLLRDGLALVFPCNRDGQVPLDAMNERLRNDYFFARACMGRRFAQPTVERTA